jgi:hypothetical protein
MRCCLLATPSINVLIVRGELFAAPSRWRTLKSRIKRRRAAVDMTAEKLCGRCWVSEVGARARWYGLAVYRT